MELVLMGLLGGFVLGMIIGWIGGRMTGIGEGQHRARRARADQYDQEFLAQMAVRHPGVDPAVLAQDSMAEFATPGDRPAGRRGAA